ncbi:hypothetical protein DE146DRAFT_676194 [Phaeosphaeria sp. MPI-PUGE-AT-0046c]|nr:hypothetical protein DE146DRAFT_676194 [Phaeosphaeria sp. MPI-PUGE-AT-0046c]
MAGTKTDIGELILLGRILWFMSLTLLTLSYITVGLRLWVRCRITKSAGWDDFSMVATLILFTCYCAFILIVTLRGQERRLFDLKDIHQSLIYVQLSEVFYILTTTMLKISLGLFFLRVLTKRWQRLLFHVLLAVSAIYGFFYVIKSIFVCGNPAKIADTMLGSKKCLPTGLILATGYLYGTLNVIADWTFVLIPISVLLDSELDRRSKISVSLVMALGAVGSVSSIMRMVYLRGLVGVPTGLNPITIRATIWATAEPGTGIIAASIAILRPLIRNITTNIRTRASVPIPRRAQKKIPDEEEDTIALTSQDSKKSSMRTEATESDPWSPTVTFGQATSTRIVSITGGKALPPLP